MLVRPTDVSAMPAVLIEPFDMSSLVATATVA